MLKINYTTDATLLDNLHQSYLRLFDVAPMQVKLDSLLSEENLSHLGGKSVNDLLIGSIEELLNFSSDLNESVTNDQIAIIKEIFNYDDSRQGQKLQPAIANFFMQQSVLDLNTCFFCNIDFINTFDFIDDFQDGYDLFKRGRTKDFVQIKGIGKVTSQKIINQRSSGATLDTLTVPTAIISSIRKLEVKQKNNHFTLDHVLDKATHPITALSLYNFVPCCYGCNSKFKKSNPIVEDDARFSPTSANFTFSTDVRFKLYFPIQDEYTYKDVNTVNDFVLKFEIDSNNENYEKYIDTFRLRARYKYHKKMLLELLNKRKAYSDTQIKEIAVLTGKSFLEVCKDIFGSEIFELPPEVKPFTKVKRDIARDLEIKEVMK